ncbi:UxaA family hydrolase [Halococcus agarilyticus]|uniref:UxaA family hydrolase n=1 Tax=Halococcus agarilyticus TaxID=1232219 RepID=UPI000677D80C|nr:UxaA family hydrolase [Halococcus agarilyticus]
MADNYIQVVDPTDNVATAIRDVEAGETVVVAVGDEERRIDVTEDVRFGHKLAIRDLSTGETVRKYGTSIGDASEDIAAGEYVHVHNVESNYGRGDLAADTATAGGE